MKDDKTIFWMQAGAIFLVSIFILSILGFIPKNLIPDEYSFSSNKPEKSSVNYSETNSVSDPNKLKEVSYVRDNQGRIARSVDNETKVVVAQSLTKPSRVFIPSVGIDTVVLQPGSPVVEVLDSALSKGAVYYPGSGFIEQGNVFIFGHSSGLPVVINQAYKTFNGIEKTKIGDEIILYDGTGKKHTYIIERVYQADSESAFIDLSRNGRRLTISTCNSFGSKTDRWVVDAVAKA